MNKAIFESLLQKPPDNEKQSHIFIVGSQQLAENIGLSGFIPVLVRNADGYVRSVDELQEIITGMLYGNHVEDYTFVPALNRRDNESLQRFFEDESLSYRDDGWKLFRKAYMCRPGADEQVGKAISRYIKSYQTPMDADASPDDDESILDTLIRLDAKNIPTNDKSLGRLYAKIFKNKHRYNPQCKDFMSYDGKKWTKDVESLEARKSAQLLSDKLIQYAVRETEGSEDKGYLKKVSRLCDLRYRESMIKDARPIYPIHAEELDSDDLILNCQNGTLCLGDDEPVFRPHDPDDMLSKVTRAEYRPGADCPEFKKAFAEIMQGNQEKIRYWQKVYGLCLTGITEQECFWIAWGKDTRNGKGTVLQSFSWMLGDYSIQMSPDSLALKNNYDSRSPSGDIARLKSVRLVIASEPKKRMVLDSALIKTLIGRDMIVARHLHERETEFLPRFKLIIDTNYLPVVNDDTIFASDRVNVFSFDRHFREEERDLKLKKKLKTKEEMSGLLNWALEGLRLYREEGLKPPKEVVEATAEYRADSDKIGSFISEALERSEVNSKAGDIYKVYAAWCSDNGYGTESKGSFFGELKTRGLFASSGTVGGVSYKNIVRGYTVRNEFQPMNQYTDVPFV